MKKGYEAPKAKKMEFNYTEAVVAASNVTLACDWYITFTQGFEGCTSTTVKTWHPDVNT